MTTLYHYGNTLQTQLLHHGENVTVLQCDSVTCLPIIIIIITITIIIIITIITIIIIIYPLTARVEEHHR